MSYDELKQGLLLHLQTNRNFVQQKLYKDFGKECTAAIDLQKLNHKKIKSSIQFVFDFGTNQQMKSFYQRLDQNIQNFITEEKRKAGGKNVEVPIDLANLFQLMIFCVNNGSQKEVSKPIQIVKQVKKNLPVQSPKVQIKKVQVQIKKVQVIKQQPKQVIQQKKKPTITLLNPQLQAKVDKIKLVKKVIQPIKVASRISSFLEIQLIPKKQQFKLQKYQMPKKSMSPRYLQNIPPPPKKPQQQTISYQALPTHLLKNDDKRRQMSGNLYKLYQHYCSQQQNKGKSATFDKIKEEMEHMTLGKFLLFCKSTQLFQSSIKINKQYLTGIFRKFSQGKQAISFQIFQKTIQNLDQTYVNQLKDKQNKTNRQNTSIATYQARLLLMNDGYKTLKKNLNMIFFTRDNENKHNQLFQSNFHNKDLTSHGGRISNQLQTDLNILKKNRTINVSQHVQKSINTQKLQKKVKKLNLEQISRKQWPKIDWLEEEFRKDQQGMPKITRRKDVVGILKKRIQQNRANQMISKSAKAQLQARQSQNASKINLKSEQQNRFPTIKR